MNDAEARLRGAEGEKKVSQELKRLSSIYAFEFVDDVYIEVAGRTTQLDHVVIDRFGLLVLETKVRNALLRGTHTGKKWTACYRAGVKKSFQNPLEQNRIHEDFLAQAIKEQGFAVGPDFVKSAVVFVDANLSALELDELAKMRVVDVADLDALFRHRSEYTVNAGDWDASRRAAALEALRRTNHSADPAVVGAHASHHGYAPTPAPTAGTAAAAMGTLSAKSPQPQFPDEYGLWASGTPLPPHHPKFRVEPSIVVLAVLGLATLGFITWVVLGVINGTAPTWVWVMLFLILVAFGGESETRSRRHRRSRGYSHQTSAPRESVGEWLTRVAIGLSLLGLLGWFLLGGGLAAMLQTMGAVGFDSSAPAQPVAAPQPTGPTVQQAQLALTEAAPEIAAKIANIDSPVISANPPYTVFTWEYVEQPNAQSEAPKTISLSLDSQGEVWGVDIH